jgi:hypothetical protein
VDTSEDADEERESSMDGDTQHDDDANVSEFVGGFEALPPKARAQVVEDARPGWGKYRRDQQQM